MTDPGASAPGHPFGERAIMRTFCAYAWYTM